MFLCSPSYQLLENALTYRYSEYITSVKARKCGWECECPEINSGNLCTCEHSDVNDGEIFTIESPYAAILIQQKCSSHEPEKILSDIRINMGSLDDFDDYGESLADVSIPKDHGLLNRIGVTPKIDKVKQTKFEMRKYYKKSSIEESSKDESDSEAEENIPRFRRISYENITNGNIDDIVGIATLYVIIPGWQSTFDQVHNAFIDNII